MKITGLLIDSEKRTVTNVEFEHSISEIHKLIKCDTFDVPFYFENKYALFVDDEGLLKDPQHFFLIPELGRPIAGNGLILGTDEDGESVSCKTEGIHVVFLDRNDVRMLARADHENVNRLRNSAPPNVIIGSSIKEVLGDDE